MLLTQMEVCILSRVIYTACSKQRGKSAKWMATKVKHFMLLDF
jgi:hypothetical protein